MNSLLKTSITLILAVFLFGLVLQACKSSKPQRIEDKKETLTQKSMINYLKLGDSITKKVQSQLITVLESAIAQKGTHGAVELCHLKALPLVDSLSKTYHCQIRRVSNKFRNPQDKPQNDIEKSTLEAFLTKFKNQEPLEPFIVESGKEVYYFKPIMIATPTCLKCHGDKNKDIDPQTLAAIKKLYPNDLAKDYKIKDFRGMWSIKF
ncbi:MAG: DUF3365 domain-containing protein [Bacteroidia bacterium]|nr:DUF3365 domain-containing protein [Bacteroidia bacterium]MDW8302599.1 DUF3365 domain-containing protein [Bacteroidia bacterium]